MFVAKSTSILRVVFVLNIVSTMILSALLFSCCRDAQHVYSGAAAKLLSTVRLLFLSPALFILLGNNDVFIMDQ